MNAEPTEAQPPSQSVYQLVGGAEFFEDLCESFYRGVSTDPVLRPMYPPDDLAEAQEKLKLFLIQYWGGPDTYSQLRGHPRLRMRHMPFPIDEVAMQAWLHHMKVALVDSSADDEIKERMWQYFTMAAAAMVNQPS